MFACDFEYDGQYLSDYGFVICNFGGSADLETVSPGSKITFNTVSKHRGKSYGLTGTQYDECITSTFQICKNPSEYEDLRIRDDEYRDVMRWLNRNEFLRFQLLNDDDTERDPCYYDASFNVSKLKVNTVLYGLELAMETDKPFGYGQEISVNWEFNHATTSHVLADISDEIGYTYPSMIITCDAFGDLSISNETENCNMVIKNVSPGETITIDGPEQIIRSSLDGHKIYDDFNFEFLRIGNTIKNRNNRIRASLPCKLKLTYSPIIKNTPD